jgi:pimeloyl-ACP methyl ester carboxylesterase
MAQDMVSLLDCLEVNQVKVVGISMGGTLALQLVLDWPERVDRLVLVNTFACLRPDHLGIWFYFALRFILVHTLGLPAQARAVAQRLFPQPQQSELRDQLIHQILQADPRGYRAAMRALARFDVRRRLKEIQALTLVITGQQDSTIPPRVQSLLVAGISSARQVFISGAGHAVSVEQPERFNQVLLDFLLN